MGDEQHERLLKDHVSDVVYDCLRQFYRTGRYGYLTIIGGEAINFYLPKDKKLVTGDYDLKFVVNPDFVAKEEDLRRANALRLRLVLSLMQCLKSIKPPAKYTDVYPKLAILIRQQPRLSYIEDNKLFVVAPHSGEERFIHYNFNKVFKILLYYRHGNGELKHFELVDLSLFYRHHEGGYSFFQKDIYDSFLKPPFNKKIPIPFIVRNDLRIPTLPYLIFDNFRMALISLDNLSLADQNEETKDKWKDKLSRYWTKINSMVGALKRKNSPKLLNDLNASMKVTFDLYEPLAFLNSICYRDGLVYTTKLQEQPECTPDYLKKLDNFKKAFDDVAKITAKLRY